MHSSTFGKGWVGMSACPLVVLACESLHVCTVCIWRCEHARFCVEVFYALYINFHSFIHSYCVLLTHLGKRRRRLNTQSCPPRTSRITVCLYLYFLVASESQAQDTQPSSVLSCPFAQVFQ